MSLKKFCLFCLLLVTVFACGGSNPKEDTERAQFPEEETLPLTIIDKGRYTLHIDEEADFQRLQNLKAFALKDKEYLTFFDYNSRNIYLYDVATDSIINKVKLAREGPHSVKNMFSIDYFFHSLDSLFINTGRFGVYLVNDRAEVLARAGAKSGGFELQRKDIALDAASYYEQGVVYGALRTSVPSIAEDFLPSRAIPPMLNAGPSINPSAI